MNQGYRYYYILNIYPPPHEKKAKNMYPSNITVYGTKWWLEP